MTNEEKFEYWLDIAQYDLKAAGTMYRGGRWLYVVFMCQQSLEKLVKGLYTLYIGDNVPQIHDTRTIFLKFRDKLTVPVEEATLDFFTRLSSKKAKDVFLWLLTLKPSTGLSGNTSTM